MSEELRNYDSSAIATLDWYTHIRTRPGMYIGSTGDGSMPDDGLYVLVKEVIDNSIDEYASGFGKEIDITVDGRRVTVRDFGRGIPLEKVIDVSSKLMTGGKFDSGVFKKSVGLNGIGIKAVNATSVYFHIVSYRNGSFRSATYSKGLLETEESGECTEKNGTLVSFIADDEVFHNYSYNMEFIETMVRNYAYLNTGLTLRLNDKVFHSANGLLDLVNETMLAEPLYPPIHLKGEDIECVITHGESNGENIASFVNGQNTTQGGTHLAAFREAVAKTVKEHFKKEFEPADIRQSIVGAISIRVNEPGFGNQTKTKLSSKDVRPGLSVRSFIGDFIEEELDNYLHKHPETASVMLKKIQASEKERKAIAGLQKNIKEKVRKASLCNKKLRDCRIHYTDINKSALAEQSSIFITEGDSASGSITKIRDVNTQAVFSLKGKPLNCVQKSEKEVRENEEMLLLKAALNVDEDMDNLRYNRIIIATDADVDGMHIRLLMVSFFLKYYPDLIRQGHVYILQTPLFRVRNKKKSIYCYSEEEKDAAIKEIGAGGEITRFKGLGEISPDEFKDFIGENIRLDQVRLDPDDNIPPLLQFYMGKNTMDRQSFIKHNLRSEVNLEIV
ncbi:MAG TPA: type IIA DNA topoisomerase subunit B [Candidatus Coprenecus pullistercoris]|nr:type IIA DNA topoisomerase subunit B [Candidatus Coprenecus pullistercoris]